MIPRWDRGKESASQYRRPKRPCSIPGLERSLGGGKGNLPVFLPGKSQGQRSLVGYSCKESDMTECAHRVTHEGRRGMERFWRMH